MKKELVSQAELRRNFKTMEFYKDKLLSLRTIDPKTKCWNYVGPRHGYGYGLMSIFGKYYKVHRLSLYLFKDFDLDSDLFVCHKCDNPPCFNPEHLFIGTHKENMADKVSKNRQIRLKGSKNPFSKITEKIVQEIRNNFDKGVTRKELSVQFSVSYPTIVKIIAREYWRHI